MKKLMLLLIFLLSFLICSCSYYEKAPAIKDTIGTQVDSLSSIDVGPATKSDNIKEDDIDSNSSDINQDEPTTANENLEIRDLENETNIIELGKEPISDEIIVNQLKYIEDTLKQDLSQRELQSAFEAYYVVTIEQSGLDGYDNSGYSGEDIFALIDGDRILEQEVGDYYYECNPDFSVAKHEITAVTEHSIFVEFFESTLEISERDFFLKPVRRVLNLLKTRRAGIIISVLYDLDLQVDQVSILYVSGDANQINRIAYGSDGSVSTYIDTKIENQFRK